MGLIILLESVKVTATVSSTRPSAAGDGVDITTWRQAGWAPTKAALFITGSETASLTSPTGGSDGPELWGYRLEAWHKLGHLNNGSAIEIAGAAQGFATEVNLVGICERLAVAGTASAGTATAKIVPIQENHLP